MQIFGRFLDWRYGSGLTSWPRYFKLCSKKHEQTSHEHKICRKCCLIQTISLPNCSVSKVTIGFSETVLRSVMGNQSAFNNPEIPCAKALVSLFSQIIVECTCEINAAEGHNEGKKRKNWGKRKERQWTDFLFPVSAVWRTSEQLVFLFWHVGPVPLFALNSFRFRGLRYFREVINFSEIRPLGK